MQNDGSIYSNLISMFSSGHFFSFHKGRCKKKRFFWRSFPNVGGWGGWFPNKVQTPQNPPKGPQKSPFSTQISPFDFPDLTKNPGVGKHIWERSPKKTLFLLLPLMDVLITHNCSAFEPSAVTATVLMCFLSWEDQPTNGRHMSVSKQRYNQLCRADF